MSAQSAQLALAVLALFAQAPAHASPITAKRAAAPRFVMPPEAANFSCAAFYGDDDAAVAAATAAYRTARLTIDSDPPADELPMDCAAIRARGNFRPRGLVYDDERGFPIAFAVNVYKARARAMLHGKAGTDSP